MAITFITQPNDFGRIYDQNRLNYKLSSSNASEINFRFYIEVFVGDINTNPVDYELVGVVRKRALGDGTCFFNPAEMWSNYLSHDLEIDIDSLNEALNSNSKFYIAVREQKGEPVATQLTSVDSDVITLYNGLQEYIPYDITEYGGGNNQWVMAGESITTGYQTAGTWANETGTFSTGSIIFNGTDIQNLTSIEVSLNDLDPTTPKNPYLNLISEGEYVVFKNSLDHNEKFMITFDTKTITDDRITWSDITYVEKSSSMDINGFSDGDKVVIDWGELNTTQGQGKYLTDAIDFMVDENDYSNLYFLSDKNDRPSAVNIKVYYWSDGSAPATGGGNIERKNYTSNNTTLNNYYNKSESAPNPTRGFEPPDLVEEPGDPASPIDPVFNYKVSSYTTGYTLDYSTLNNQMYYIPTGPKELNKMGIFDYANSYGDGWVSYKINLTDVVGTSPSYIYNKFPMYYYRQDKCDKYDAMQLFWLNPHGGFDRYTFYKKNYISYDLERTTWEHRFSDTYVLGERGTTIYKTKAEKNVELNTDWLSASEAQTLGQMMMSPEVFAVYEYKDNVYKIPYVINDNSFEYKEKKNEKMVSMKINITPAWSRTSQTS